ncbi:MAG: DUF1801 domain-containing protein [Micrococcales bacterium]
MTNETFSKEEKVAMRELARERKANLNKAEALQGVLDKIAKMAPADRKLAEKLHAMVTKNFSDLTAKTWYGMQAYFKDDKVILFFQDGGHFKNRYSTLGFQQAANLDSGAMWPTSYALIEITPEIEKQILSLISKALS